MQVPASIVRKLEMRQQEDAFRVLRVQDPGRIDFSSNDYLGIVRSGTLKPQEGLATGATGSRLLTGHAVLCDTVEAQIAVFHKAESALIFNSGYAANLGLIASVPQREDTLLYDERCHASIRDGVRLSLARSYSFRHNDVENLRQKIRNASGAVYIVVESVYSMDGDRAPLTELTDVCLETGAHLIVDEAHATGLFGEKGEGMVVEMGLEQEVFCRVHTFGKSLGCMGAAVVGPLQLREYLINFARPLIYTTALPPVAVDIIRQSYALFPGMMKERDDIASLTTYLYNALVSRFGGRVTGKHGPILSLQVPGNAEVKKWCAVLQQEGMDIRPILSPTVARGTERIRICIHAYNTSGDADLLLSVLDGMA
ncbi:MAG: aminotransferase class I/II-fold pyridoxal phosphate-dependent enzyme [Flavobacteriales bacterium]|nr:aminotransferase class I/II-fold pyridoxal phosphate-dependent enzyme [Flavobacteriales bacterium]